MQAQNEIIQMMKKRDKMNHSALAQIESGSNGRKFATNLPPSQSKAANG